jgi:hypothetical protein
VNAVSNCSDVRYAVIAGLQSETDHERLVIAYPNERLLRDLMAAPSILAVGFSSREEAVASSRDSLSAVAHQQMPETLADGETETQRPRSIWAQPRGQTSSTLRKLTRFLVTSYSDAVTTVIAIFSSGNAVSAAIRMALGSSV